MTKNEHPDKTKNEIKIELSEDLESQLIGTYCDAVIRLMWLSFLDPDMSEPQFQHHLARESARVSKVLDQALESLKEGIKKILQDSISTSDIRGYFRVKILNILFQLFETKDGREQLPKFQKLRDAFSIPTELDQDLQMTVRRFSEMGRKDDRAFVRLLEKLSMESNEVWVSSTEHQSVFAQVFGPFMAVTANDWLKRVKPLTPDLISTVRQVTVELIEWLAYHPNATSSLAWDAFEKIIAELLASMGFEVQLTARTPDASADIIAIRKDKLGIETRYLVECKRFRDDRRVDLSVVNCVLGAKKRAGADHALLVTTSDFTRHVRKLQESLQDHRLHLRDGHHVREWLASYEPTRHSGLWLDPAWDLDNA